jgi:hypothetical protein
VKHKEEIKKHKNKLKVHLKKNLRADHLRKKAEGENPRVGKK